MLTHNQQERLVRLAKNFIKRKLEGKQAYKVCDHEGCYSWYFKFTESFGIKIFRDGDTPNYVRKFERQAKAYEMGIAPYCFGMFTIRVEGKTYACNITEHVVIHREIHGKIGSSNMKQQLQIRHMRRRTEKAFAFSFYDCHNANIGVRSEFRRKNQMMIIDFDM